MSDDWWCVPVLSRKARKRKGLRRQPKPRRSSPDKCWPFGYPADGEVITGSSHRNCGYRDPLGRVIPWAYDQRRRDGGFIRTAIR